MMNFKDEKREKIIIKIALLGIVLNIFLASIKILIALASNSVAVISDAINNISDAFSSVITIFGSKLATKLPDENHPYGYGRTEYIGGLIVSVIVLMLGLNFLKASVEVIIEPKQTNFEFVAILFLAFAMILKFLIAKIYKKVGNDTESISLKAVGAEAFGDAIISFIILISAGVSYFYGIFIDGWAGILASGFIIFNGIVLIKQTFDKIIGVRVEQEVSQKVYMAVKECEIVLGAYDLILHNYGVERYVGSINVEVDEHLKISDISSKLNELQIKIYNRYRIYLVFGIYSINLGQNNAKECVINALSDLKSILSIHAFFIDLKQKRIRFDVVVDFKEQNLAQLRKEIEKRVSERFGGFEIFIVIDREFS
ncbi:cation diffusion facilitator family transporter [Campylobacter mucosalis]|uniref:cation diffusion facilitator family transporter n=1 Tax=Campylobacter mucosalis TaxID=202 RepID=UPI0014700F26|nr:cation diffusion facilitator family transporter [Campylobacter mucosalis]